MITVTLNNTTNINVSLQVGDLIYARTPYEQIANGISEGFLVGMVGILRRIDIFSNDIVLLIDDTFPSNPYNVSQGDFIMFSKYDQSMGDVIGYYAQAKFVNNSREKAEIFSVGSEVVINSK